jgi:3',5'-cyclic AMP phosphodiesterase CpdA
MKILIYSDLHNEFEPFAPDLQSCRAADVIVLAGDTDIRLHGVDWAKRLSEQAGDKPVIMVAGNHEFYGGKFNSVVEAMREATRGTQVHVLEDEVLTLNGVRFLGSTLWTDFKLNGADEAMLQALIDARYRMSDYRTVLFDLPDFYRKLEPEDTMRRHIQSRIWLERQLAVPFDGATVVVTHHAPSRLSLARSDMDEAVTPSYASALETLMSERLNLWLHGHIHRSADYRLHGTRVVSNPRGYLPFAPNPDFDPKKLISL